MCAAISLRGLLHHHAKLGPYNTQHILTFLDALHDAVVQDRSDQSSPGLLLSGIMLVSTGLLWSRTGSPTMIN